MQRSGGGLVRSLKAALTACAVALAFGAAGCGSNSTAIQVTVVDPSQPNSSTAVTILENSTNLLFATVTGTSTNTVSWYVCLPSTVATAKPTNCTPNLTGYGTITQTGLYTAPPTRPSPNSFVIMATSAVNPASFGILGVQISSGITVTFSTPSAISMATSETYTLTATVRGTTNTALVWAVDGMAGGNSTDGTIAPSGQDSAIYTAPSTVPSGSITVTATSAADSSVSATATLTVSALVDPTVTTIEPPIASAGSAQQVVDVTGTNFLNTSTVAVPISGILTAVPTDFVNATTLEATLPAAALQTSGNLPVQVQAQNKNLSTTSGNLQLVAVRPALLGMAPQTVSQSAGGAGLSLNLAGGFFSGGMAASFNGSTAGVTTSLTSSRQMTVGIPAGAYSNPGLYPLIVQNTAAAAAGVPSMAGLNLAVTPNPASIPGTVASVAVGTNPSAVAIDRVAGLALVVNKGTGANGDGSVSVIDLSANALATTYSTIGNGPTGIAVDDLLPQHLALVVNNADKTVAGINLTTGAVTTVSVAIGTQAYGTPILPYSVGVNPLTHRAIVTYQSSNQATILDTSTGVPVIVGTPGSVGGTLTSYSTGFTPSVAIDPNLNWAVITPGGEGGINIVDLGTDAIPGGLPARSPLVVASLSIASSLTVRGVGIDTQSHQVLFTDSNPGGTNQDTDFTAFSLLDQSVSPIAFTSGGQPVTVAGFVAAAVNPLTSVGIAVNQIDNSATVVNLQTGNVLVSSVPLGNTPVAVAVDPASNEAVVANQADGTASIVSLGAINPLQIVESTPDMTLTSSANPLSLAIVGSGFSSTSQVLLDGAVVPGAAVVSANGREITVGVPAGGAANLLGSARRFLVQVQNTDGAVSNVSGLTVVQAIPVGNSPVGVAVDTDRDLAVVTNSADNTVSLVALTTAQTGAVGTIATQPVGAGPKGVAIYPLGGLALVANNAGNNVSVVDDNFIAGSQLNGAYPVALCAPGPGTVGCTGPTGVAVDPLSGIGIVTNSTSNNVSTIDLSTGVAATAGTTTAVDAFPNAAAIDPDPNLNLAAVTAASPTSTPPNPTSLLDFVSLGPTTAPPRDPGFQLPTGVVFDPLNEMFVVANSLQNQVMIVDPATGINTPVPVGIDPTSIDYDYQTSTLVTANAESRTISEIEYVCAPNGSGAFIGCPAPQVQAILPLAGSQQFSIAVDPRLNLAVLVDQADNQVLLVPLSF